MQLLQLKRTRQKPDIELAVSDHGNLLRRPVNGFPYPTFKKEVNEFMALKASAGGFCQAINEDSAQKRKEKEDPDDFEERNKKGGILSL